MAVGGEIVARAKAVLTVDTAGLKRGLAEAESAMKGSSTRMAKVGAVSGKVAAGGLALMAGAAYESAKAAVDMQQSHDRLIQSVDNAGLSMKGAGRQLDLYSQKQAKFGVNLSDAQGYLAQFVTATGSARKSMRDLTLAEDIAAAKHIDLGSAVQMVTKAQAGSTRMMTASGLIFKPYTGYVDKVTAAYKKLASESTNGLTPAQTAAEKAALANARVLDKQRNATELLRIGFRKYGGDASAESETLEGKWKMLHAEADNLEITLGRKLLPAITRLTNWISRNAGEAKLLGAAFVGIVGGAIAITTAVKVATAWSKAYTAATKTLTLAQRLLGPTMATTAVETEAAGTAIATTGTESEVAAGQMSLLEGAAGEAGAAGALGLLGPAAIAAGLGLAALYKSSEPNLHLSKKYTQALEEVTSALHAGHLTADQYNQVITKATRVSGDGQRAFAKLAKSGIDVNDDIAHMHQTVTNYINNMAKAAKETGNLAAANNKTNPTLAAGYEKAHDYALAAQMLATNLGRIPARTDISVVMSILENFSSQGNAPNQGPSAGGAPNQRGGYISGSGSGDIVRAMLEPGEGVINRRAVQALGGRHAIDAINRAVPRFQSGGLVPPPRHKKEKRGAYRSRVSQWLGTAVDTRFNRLDFGLQLADRIAQRDDSEGNITGELAQLAKEQKIRGEEITLYGKGHKVARRFGLQGLATQYSQAAQMIHQDILDTADTIKGLRGQTGIGGSVSQAMLDAFLQAQQGFISQFAGNINLTAPAAAPAAAASPSVVHNHHYSFVQTPPDAFVHLRKARLAAAAVFQ